MTCMEECMIKLWRNQTKIFQKEIHRFESMSEDELYRHAIQIKMNSYEMGINGGLCALVTVGCQNHLLNGKLSGCSMCNLHAPPSQDACLFVLRKRNVQLYSEAMHQIYINKRGKKTRRTMYEFFLSCGFLNERNVPEQMLATFFGPDGILRKRPLYMEFETTVDSVTHENIVRLERYTGKHGLTFRIGIECHSEWIRKYWLNKHITNVQIESAISLCHKHGHKITANVLLGLPCLPERIILDEFIQTILWLSKLGVDAFSISILYRSPITLQGFIYDNLRNNPNLQFHGLVNQEHTGLPWLFTIIQAIQWCEDHIPRFKEQWGFGNFDENAILEFSGIAYNSSTTCHCYHEIYEAFRRFAYQKDRNALESLYKKFDNDTCMKDYCQLLKKQEKITDVRHAVALLFKESARILWPSKWREMYQRFQTECNI